MTIARSPSPTYPAPTRERWLRQPATASGRSLVTTDIDRFVVRAMTMAMAVAVVTQKVALPIDPGKIALQITLVVEYGLLAALMIAGRLRISLPKLLMFCVFGGLAVFVHLFRGKLDFSLPSLLYVLMIYICYIFTVPVSRSTLDSYLKNFQIMGLCAAALVAIDWVCQIIFHFMPSIEAIIPKPLLFFNYVYIQPLEWGARYLKPNGFFFLETSYVSQFCAFALVIELCLFRRFVYIGALGAGLICSFGGTGMTLVLLSTPVILFYFRLKLLPLVLIGAPVALATAYQIGLVDNITKRSAEFGKEGSSGNQRFNVQFERVAEVFQGDIREAMLGIGAGQMPQYLNIMWTPVSKVIVEYGIFVYVAFWLFLFFVMFGRGVPFVLSWIALMQYVFLNGSFLVPLNCFYNFMFATLLMVAGTPRLPASRNRALRPE